MLHTKDYKHFRVIYPNGTEVAFEGASYAHRALPGDTLEIHGDVKKVVKRAKHGPLIGVLELASKMRFGMTARNNPIYRFTPFNESYPPFFVGCSQKDVSTNVLARVEFINWDAGTCPRGNLLEILGACGDLEAEELALLLEACPAKWPKIDILPPYISPNLVAIIGETFHIDPPGCRDIDDAITLLPYKGGTEVKIHIANVGAWLLTNPALKKAATFGQTYYSDGVAVKPMFPVHLSEDLFSLVPGKARQTVTFTFFWDGRAYLDESYWSIEMLTVSKTYTYDTFYDSKYAKMLGEICSSLAGKTLTDSHEWVEQLMLTYNTEAAGLLKSLGTGVLRRHAGKDQERYSQLEALGLPAHKLAMRAGEYCAAFEQDTEHCGLARSAYCHASSPIRRWADCINQLALLDIIDSGEYTLEADVPAQVASLNALAKLSKRFERDVLFMRALLTQKGGIDAVIVERSSKTRLWVPDWNQIVSSTYEGGGQPGDKVTMTFFADATQRSWKRRLVIRWTNPHLGLSGQSAGADSAPLSQESTQDTLQKGDQSPYK
jgi:exoribonuclease R